MDAPFRIEKKESFRVVGYYVHTTNQKNKGRKDSPALWVKFREENLQEQLMPLMNQEPFGLLGICTYNVDSDDSRKFDYYIAVSSDQEPKEEMGSYIVPAATWAVFPCTPETIGKTEVNAIMKWLPKSGYKAINSGYITGCMNGPYPDIEHYDKDGSVEIWVAIKEK